jgi:hypothetical protein
VACGAELVGALIGDDVDCRAVEPGVRVEAAVWLGWLLWPVRPSPRAAPTALTTPSPARATRRRQLRFVGVMARQWLASLCMPCADVVSG